MKTMNDELQQSWTAAHPRLKWLCIALLAAPFAYAFTKAQLISAGVNLSPITIIDKALMGLSPMFIATAGVIEWKDRSKHRILFITVLVLGGVIATAGTMYSIFK